MSRYSRLIPEHHRTETAMLMRCSHAEIDVSAEVNLETEFGEHRGFDTARAMGLLFIRSINDLDVIRLMPRHHLVASDAVEDRVHNRPLRRGFAPPPLRFFRRELHNFRNSEVAMQF